MVAAKKASKAQKKAKASAKKKVAASAKKKVAASKKPSTEYFGFLTRHPPSIGTNDKSRNRGADRTRSTGSNSRGR
jgi:membrane protein involved in colicin uptake